MEPYDAVVLGGGPGGYVAAIRAAQLGMRVALVEKADLGGICLNWGCIPSKALIHNAEVLDLIHRADEFGFAVSGVQADLAKAVQRSRKVVDRMVKGVAFLMRKNKIDVVRGEATLRSATEIEVKPEGQVLTTKHVILATGARPLELPNLPIDGQQVIGSYEALQTNETPASVVVVGAGPVGLEFAYVWSTYGAKVTVVEALPRVLPQEDEDISSALEKALAKHGISFITGAPVEDVERGDGGVAVRLNRDGRTEVVHAEKVLVGIGVQGNSDGLGLEALGVEINRSWTPVNERMQTSVPTIYAIGDLTGPPLLAHVASAQGVTAAEAIAGLSPQPLDYDQMPRATYCRPEVASIGLTERQARERGHEVRAGSFPFRPNGRALALGEPDGFIKVVGDTRTGEILGIHMLGAGVSELLGEAALARTLEATPAELGFTVHAHPTMSEVLKEAALAVRGEAIHI
ncbi:MAG: dihydrolipoyl dehydrogenase [Chloroflexi bacterium]|nr:dihydrolipoyl dehydrogenase [Chloroflexota bacterium]